MSNAWSGSEAGARERHGALARRINRWRASGWRRLAIGLALGFLLLLLLSAALPGCAAEGRRAEVDAAPVALVLVVLVVLCAVWALLVAAALMACRHLWLLFFKPTHAQRPGVCVAIVVTGDDEVRGMSLTRLTVTVGQVRIVRAVPKRADGTVDDSLDLVGEGTPYGWKAGDNSPFELKPSDDGDPTVVKIGGLRPGSGVALFKCDADAGPELAEVEATLLVDVVDGNATRVEFEEVAGLGVVDDDDETAAA